MAGSEASSSPFIIGAISGAAWPVLNSQGLPRKKKRNGGGPVWNPNEKHLVADSNYPAGTILDHTGDQTNAVFVNPTPSIITVDSGAHQHHPYNETLTAVPALWHSSSDQRPVEPPPHLPEEEIINSYTCHICQGTGRGPMMTGKESRVDPDDPFDSPPGQMETFPCTACGGTGKPPIPLGEFLV